MNQGQVDDREAGGPQAPGEGDSSAGSDQTPGAADVASAPTSHGPADLPDFELLAEIGRGGFGSVWIAKHRHTGDAVAIKFIPPRSRETELKGLQMLRQRVREGQDHLVWTEYIGEAGDFIYCVMDLADNVVDGPLFPDRYEALTLFKYLKQRGRLDLADAQEVALSMAKGLSFLQQVGLRHGDVKPANVLRVRGRWKLADYGMMGGIDAKARGGTRSYVPPEGPHGERADQYALGIVVHELVFGRKPSKEISTWPSSRLGTGLRRICERMLDSESSRRFASMGEVVEAIEALGTGRGGRAAGGSACPHCGEAVDGEQEVCGGCGGDLWQTCPACQHRGSVLQRFCTKCRAPVHAIAALEQELDEAAALLPEGRHREVVSRAEGPLADLCSEVEHQLARMQGGDLARTRRANELRERLDGRRRRLVQQANELRAVDERIASAHAEGLVTELRAAVESALTLLPESPNYRKLRAELPKLEAQAAWNALLAELGSPHRESRRMRGNDLRRAIRTIRLRTPDDPDVRKEADRLVEQLMAEQARRLRESCLRRAARQREAGRPVEALEALRVAESSGVADDEVSGEIADLVGRLEKDRLPELLETLEGIDGKGVSHGRLRRSIRELEAIRPGESRLPGWKANWARRRRLNLLQRIKGRCLVAIAAEDVPSWQHLLALAYRIAGRDAALADRVLQLDNALQARWNALAAAARDAAAAEAAGDVVEAYEKWREAAEIASESPRIAERLAVAREAAEVYPRQRRRRLIVATLGTSILLAIAGAISWQAWNWSRLDRWLQNEVALEAATAGEFTSRLDEVADRSRFPLGTWGLDGRLREVWRSRLEEGVPLVAVGGMSTPDQLGLLAAGYLSVGGGDPTWLAEQVLLQLEKMPDERPDPSRLRLLDRFCIAAGISELVGDGIREVSIRPLSRIAEGERIANLAAWWRIVEERDPDSADGAGLTTEVVETFERRSELESREIGRVARVLDAELGNALRTGRLDGPERIEVAQEVVSMPPEPWCDDRVLAARATLEATIARFERLAEEGRVELDVPGMGTRTFRLVASGGRGVLVADRQVDAASWATWAGGNGAAAGGTEPARGFPVAAFRERMSRLEAESLGLRLIAVVPDPEQWNAWDRLLRERDGVGIRSNEDRLDDLAIRGDGQAMRAYAMPDGYPILLSGSAEVAGRLFLQAE